jgi:hypothetical protein
MYTPSQKRATNNWISKNKDKWNMLCRENSRIYYDNHKEEKKQKCLDRYYVKREFEIFRRILL